MALFGRVGLFATNNLGGGGVSKFTELTDTFNSYTNANALLRTNSTPDGLIETTTTLTEAANEFELVNGTAKLGVPGALSDGLVKTTAGTLSGGNSVDLANEVAGTLPISSVSIVSNITALSTGLADNNKLITQGYFNDNIPAGGNQGITQSFSSATSVTVTTNFNAFPIVQVLNSLNQVIDDPALITITNTNINEFVVDFSAPTSGRIVAVSSGQANASTDFTSVWKTDNPGVSASNQVTIPTRSSGTYNVSTLDWGDGIVDTNITTWNDPRLTHTYAVAGTYVVTMSGVIDEFRFNDGGDRQKFLSILNFGTLVLGSDGNYFRGCINLTLDNVADVPDLSSVSNFEGIFNGCSSLVNIFNIELWDVSGIINAGFAFFNCPLFNGNVEQWDLSNATVLQQMFFGCDAFNRRLNGNFASCINMNSILRNCILYNQPIQHWSFPNLLSLNNILDGCEAFDQPIDGLDVSNKTSLNSSFKGCILLNQPIPSWNTSSVFIFNSFLEGCVAYDQDLSTLDMSNVIQATNMLAGVTLSTYNYTQFLISINSQVLKPNVPFSGGNSQYFIQAEASRTNMISVDNWTIIDGGLEVSFAFVVKTNNSGASNNDQFLLPLLSGGTYINANISWGEGSSDVINTWNDPNKTHTYPVAGTYIINITGTITGWAFEDFVNPHDPVKFLEVLSFGPLKPGNTGNNFRGCSNLTLVNVVDALDMTGVTNCFAMFSGCMALTTINNVGSWDMVLVESIASMFASSNFNDDISAWITTALTNMGGTFASNGSFNQDITGLDTSNVNNMQLTFSLALSYDQDLGSLNVSSLQFANLMFNGIALSTPNYDSLFIGWNGQILKPNVSFTGGNSQYTAGGAAEAARTNMISVDNWTIVDAGPAP